MRDFVRVWAMGYGRPRAFAEGLRGRSAPLWGLLGAGIRALMDALLLYLPLALLGRQPSMASWLTFAPTESYFRTLIWLAPIVLLCQWLAVAAAMHLVLRLTGRRSDFDLLLTLSGMVELVVGAFLVAWDWAFVALGSTDYVLLGASHLVIDLWGIVLSVVALRRLMGVPVGLGILLNLVMLVVGLPFGMVFMRAPV